MIKIYEKNADFSPPFLHQNEQIKAFFGIRDMTFECNLPTNLERKKMKLCPPGLAQELFVRMKKVRKKMNVFI